MSAGTSEHSQARDIATWESAVRWLRAQPDMAHVVEQSYLGDDVAAETRRFGAGAEFSATCRLLGLPAASRPVRVLDIGAGNGIAAAAFARMGHEVVALDPDLSPSVGLNAVRIAGAGLHDAALHVCCGIAETLPFGDASFDVIYARQTLHHICDLPRGLAECRRVLRPGGLMLAVREHVADNEAQLQAFLGDHPLHWLYGGEHAYRLDEYLGAADQAGMVLHHMLGPYDTVINAFPKTEHQLRDEAVGNLSRRTGPMISRMALALPPVLRWYLARMSRFDRTPGRLYSFLWRRPDTAA